MPDIVISKTELQEKKRQKKQFAKLGWAFNIFFILTAIVAPFVSAGISANLFTSSDKWWINLLLPYFLGVPVFCLISRLIPNLPKTDPLNHSQTTPHKNLFYGFFIFLAASKLTSFFFSLADGFYPYVDGAYAYFPTSIKLSIFMFLESMLLRPVLEEIVFRYLPYKKLGVYGEKYYILFTTFIYALVNLAPFASDYSMRSRALLGVFLSWVFYRTGKLLYSILFHSLAAFFSQMPFLAAVFFPGNIPVWITAVVIDILYWAVGLVALILFIKKDIYVIHGKPPKMERGLVIPSKVIFFNAGTIFCLVLTIGWKIYESRSYILSYLNIIY